MRDSSDLNENMLKNERIKLYRSLQKCKTGRKPAGKSDSYNLRKRLLLYMLLFVSGSMIYISAGLLLNAYVHPAMPFLGGIFMIIANTVSEAAECSPVFIRRALPCAAVILCEAVYILLLSRIFGIQTPDYTDEPVNLIGILCLRSVVLWCVFAAVRPVICRRAKELLHGFSSDHD